MVPESWKTYEPFASVVGSAETNTGMEIESPGLVTEVAIKVTLLPACTREDAVKVAVAPLAVLAGLNEPHGTALAPHVAVQLTPLFEVSPVTVTAIGAEAPSCMAFGGKMLTASASGGAPSAMVADTDFVLSVTDVAVTVTELLVADGRAEGAVYVVDVPGPVVLNEPHAPLPAHVTVHFTPAFAESFRIVTANDAVAFTCIDVGAAELNTTEIGSAGVVVLDEPPQETCVAHTLTAANSKIHWRNGMGPPWGRSVANLAYDLS